MNKEEAATAMKALSSKFGVEEGALKTRFNELLISPAIKDLKTEDKYLFATRMLRAKLVAGSVKAAEDVEFGVIDKGEVVEQKGKKPWAVAYGLVEGVYAKVTFFEEAIADFEKLTAGKVYTFKATQAQGATQKPARALIAQSSITETTKTLGKEDILTSIRTSLPRAPVIEVKEWVGEAADRSDVVHVEGDIVMRNVNTNKEDGRKFGNLLMTDDSVPTEDLSTKSALRVNVDSLHLDYGVGSHIIVVGKVEKSDKGIRMRGEAVVPIVMLPVEADDSAE